MADITLPTPYAQSVRWRLVMPSQQNVSEWTGSRQVMASNRGWWECTYQLPPIVGESAFNSWRSFLAKSQGMVKTFEVRTGPSKQSLYKGFTVRVNGGSQTGRSLITDGWPPNCSPLSAGNHITINDQLLILTADVSSNSSGQSTIEFEPPIRVSPSDNDEIEWIEPYCLMSLVEQPYYSGEAGAIFGLSLDLREAF